MYHQPSKMLRVSLFVRDSTYMYIKHSVVECWVTQGQAKRP